MNAPLLDDLKIFLRSELVELLETHMGIAAEAGEHLDATALADIDRVTDDAIQIVKEQLDAGN